VEIAFDKLIRLQHVDSEINTISFLLEAIPAKIEAIDNEIKATAEIIARAKEKLTGNQKKRRDMESEVKDVKGQAAKFKRQLNDVKTNKEYTALLKEIEETEHKADAIEEAIIHEMIGADDIEKEIKSANVRKAEEEGRLQKDKQSIFEEQKELEAKKEVLVKERQGILPLIPPDQIRLYNRIRAKLNGVALSPVTDDFCSLCQMRIRPQLVNEIIEMRKIITCEACGRILYWPKPPVEDIPEEKADDPDKADDSAPR
jgi:predicted  nucleic acid-binding Zn-ribbon protein